MTYITENIIAMGFPAGDMSSGFFGYVEVTSCDSMHLNLYMTGNKLILMDNHIQGFYRNHMEEVIKFFETHHKVFTSFLDTCIYLLLSNTNPYASKNNAFFFI